MWHAFISQVQWRSFQISIQQHLLLLDVMHPNSKESGKFLCRLVELFSEREKSVTCAVTYVCLQISLAVCVGT